MVFQRVSLFDASSLEGGPEACSPGKFSNFALLESPKMH